MTTITRNQTKRSFGLFSDMSKRLNNYRVYSTTRNELNSLSDRELNDLGIHRSSIRSIAYQAAYGG